MVATGVSGMFGLVVPGLENLLGSGELLGGDNALMGAFAHGYGCAVGVSAPRYGAFIVAVGEHVTDPVAQEGFAVDVEDALISEYLGDLTLGLVLECEIEDSPDECAGLWVRREFVALSGAVLDWNFHHALRGSPCQEEAPAGQVVSASADIFGDESRGVFVYCLYDTLMELTGCGVSGVFVDRDDGDAFFAKAVLVDRALCPIPEKP